MTMGRSLAVCSCCHGCKNKNKIQKTKNKKIASPSFSVVFRLCAGDSLSYKTKTEASVSVPSYREPLLHTNMLADKTMKKY